MFAKPHRLLCPNLHYLCARTLICLTHVHRVKPLKAFHFLIRYEVMVAITFHQALVDVNFRIPDILWDFVVRALKNDWKINGFRIGWVKIVNAANEVWFKGSKWMLLAFFVQINLELRGQKSTDLFTLHNLWIFCWQLKSNWFREGAWIVSVEYMINFIVFLDRFHDMRTFSENGGSSYEVRFGHFQWVLLLNIVELNSLFMEILRRENIGSFLGLFLASLFKLNWFKFRFRLNCFDALLRILLFYFMTLMRSNVVDVIFMSRWVNEDFERFFWCFCLQWESFS